MNEAYIPACTHGDQKLLCPQTPRPHSWWHLVSTLLCMPPELGQIPSESRNRGTASAAFGCPLQINIYPFMYITTAGTDLDCTQF
jgi:hypothetical protein